MILPRWCVGWVLQDEPSKDWSANRWALLRVFDNSVTHTTYWPTGLEKASYGSQTNPTVKLYTAEGQLHKLRTFRSANLALAPDENTANYDETTWTYNARNQLTRKQYADTKGTDYTYTPGGKLLTRTWARGVVTTYGYNSAGELTTTDYSDTTPDVTITHDKLGRQQSVTNGVATSIFAYTATTLALDTETITYNLPGQPAFTRVLDRSRDALGRDTGYTLRSADVSSATETQATYAYSATTGRLSSISNPQLSNVSFAYDYVPGSSLIEKVTGPAHTVTNQWEPTRNVLASKENKAGTTVISRYDYAVNALGQRTNVTTSGTAFPATPSWAWGYDSLGQVTSADHNMDNSFDRAYQYDAIGNRLQGTAGVSPASVTTYTSNALNQYSSLSLNSQPPTLNQYDNDGNLTSGQLPTGSAGLVWDAENRLIAVNVIGQDTIHYTYDAQSRRISRSVGVSPTVSSTIYIYDAWNVIAEYSSPNLQSPISNVRSYLWGTDLSGSPQGAGGVGGLLSLTINNQPSTLNFFPTFDGNGNVSEYLASNGSVTAHFEYDPFGNTVVNTDASNQFAYRFSTKPLDKTTGLYYYGYRYYDPETGRWPSRDPIWENGGINLYGFNNNNGLSYFDFLGASVVTVPDVEVPIGSGNSATFATETPIYECVPGTLAGVRVCYNTGRTLRRTKTVSLNLNVVSDFKVDFCNKKISQSGAISIAGTTVDWMEFSFGPVSGKYKITAKNQGISTRSVSWSPEFYGFSCVTFNARATADVSISTELGFGMSIEVPGNFELGGSIKAGKTYTGRVSGESAEITVCGCCVDDLEY